MSRLAHAPAVVLGIALGACGGGDEARDTGAARADASIAHVELAREGPVVATVDGEPITLAEVQETATTTGLAPIDALHRLEEERVLYRHALAASVDATEADRGARRAAVQALLHARIEDVVDSSTVTDAEVMARYDATRASFVQPERRESVHVLAQLPEHADEAALAAAQRFIRRVISELSTEADPAAAADRYRSEDSEGRSFRIVVEHLPAASRAAPLEAPYIDALFSREGVGVVAEPVRTTHGFHAVIVSHVEPSFRVPLDEAEPMLRRQIVAEHRAAALEALERQLRARTPVAIDEAVASAALSADLAPNEAALGTVAP